MSIKASEDLKLFCADPYTGWVPREKQQDELRKIAARVEEVEQRAEELEHALEDARAGLEKWHDRAVMLPTDAEGVPIHVGDELEGYDKTIEVMELRYGRSGWVLVSRDGNSYHDTFAFEHHHEQTVEDVLQKFGDWYAHTKGGCDEDGIIAEYAAKLRLAGEE